MRGRGVINVCVCVEERGKMCWVGVLNRSRSHHRDSSARPSAALASLSTNTGTSALCDSDTLESLTRSPTLRDPPGFPKLGRHRNYYSSLLLPQNSAPQVCMYACMHGASSLPTRQRARPPSAVIANIIESTGSVECALTDKFTTHTHTK